MFCSVGKGGMEGGSEIQRGGGREGPAACDRHQVRVGTPALNEDEETVDNEAALTMTGQMFIPL